MRTCPNCGLENPADQDFCSCGEYLRWEPTGFMAAIPSAPEAASPGAAAPAPAAPAVSSAGTPAAPTPAAPTPAARDTAPRAAIPAQPPAAPPPPPAARPVPDSASITLRLPDDDATRGETIATAVDPGGRAAVLALVRNQSGIVDNYDLELEGIPGAWYTIIPATVYLVPFGSNGAYEQEVRIELHPPRTAEAQARVWDLDMVAKSKAEARAAASAPFALAIQPFEQLETKVGPERRAGRRKVRFDVTVRNRANAPAAVALGAQDADGECRTAFDERAMPIEPGETKTTQLTVRPPKQIWLGRPTDWRLQVAAATGEEGTRLLSRDDGAAAARGRGIPGLPKNLPGGIQGPGMNIGPGGVHVRMPQVRSFNPQSRIPNLDVGRLLRPAGGAPAPVAAPLLPLQVVFRQRPWLPWWLAVVAPLLAVLALFLLALSPEKAVVPQVQGAASVFAAQQKLEGAGLGLDPTVQKVVKAGKKPGTVLSQAPLAGKEVDEGSTVVLQVAVGSGSVKVPSVVGQNLADAEKTLRTAGLVIGRTSVTPPDPKAKIGSQIPAAKELVKNGNPVDIYYRDPRAAKAAAAGGAAAGGGKGDDVTVPPIKPADDQGYSAKLSDAGLVPQAVRQFDTGKLGTVFATEPAVGEKVAKGATVKVLVSAGFPELVYDNDSNVLLINGASGKSLGPIGKTDAVEKDPTWTADGAHVAYTSDGRLMVANPATPNAAPIPISPAGVTYADPSFAPTPTDEVLASARINVAGGRQDTDLCLGRVTNEGYDPQCITDPSFAVADVSWAPDGKSILVPAVSAKGAGIVRYHSGRAFSPRASDWHGGTFVTTLDPTRATGTIDAAFSPDGKSLAMVSNLDTPELRLYITTPGDFKLEKAKPLPVQACKVAWRADSEEVVVVQEDAHCTQDTGQLARITVGKTPQAVPLAASGDNPAYQPLIAGG